MLMASFSPYALSQDSYMRSELNFNGDCSVNLSDAVAGLKSLAETDADEGTMGKIIYILQMMANAVSDEIYDGYEDDNGFDKARVIAITSKKPQYRNFHDVDDEDWVMFYGLNGRIYEIEAEVESLGSDCDAVIELYNDSNDRLERYNQFPLSGKNENLIWKCTEDGVYYIRLTNGPYMFGENMRYNLTVYRPVACIRRGRIIGNIIDAASAQFTLTQDCLDILRDDGFQQMDRLNALKDKNYANTEAFERALDDALNEDRNILEEWTEKDYTLQNYKARIMECAVDKSAPKVAGAIIKTEWESAISNDCDCFSYYKRDYCIYFHTADEESGYDMTVEADGYETATVKVRVKDSFATLQNVYVKRAK